MGKKMTKKNMPEKPRTTLKAGAIALLVVAGVGAMAGMALFNGSAKPNRDMQWYLKKGEVEIAAPAMGGGYDGAPAVTGDGVPYMSAGALRQDGAVQEASLAEADAGADFAETADLPSDGVAEPAGTVAAQTDTPEAAPDASQSDLPEAAPVTADVGTPEQSSEGTEVAAPEEAQPEQAAEPEEPAPTGPVTITITAAGDCTFGGEVGSKSYRRFTQYMDEYGADYFFQNVRQIFEADDLTIVNLEGPLTTAEKTSKHGYIFKGDPSYVTLLTGSSVELCNLANNHILDYGNTGISDTANTLDAFGVGYCGFTQAYNAVIKGVRVTALGFTKWDHTEEQIVQAVAEARKNCDLLIVNMHWGWESQHEHVPAQTSVGRAAIDAGADLVIGTHPHVYQGIEKYKGRYIVYSLGNFCFAGNANPTDKRCLIFQQSFGFTPGMGMAQAGFTDLGINIIPASISSVREENNFQPTVMPAEEGAELLKAVASVSTNFSMADTVWMKNNYLVSYGLLTNKDGQPAEPVPADLPSGTTEGADQAADGASET